MSKYVRPQMASRIQIYDRMRVPIEAKPFGLRFQVIQAVRRSPAIANGSSAYQNALEDLIHGENSQLFDEVNFLMITVLSENLKGKELEAVDEVMRKTCSAEFVDNDYKHVERFNQEFLNGNGLDALAWALLIDAAQLNLAAIDRFRGGPDLQAAYGPRRTQSLKRRGTHIQSRLKRFASFDEPAMIEAADRYVVYRHLDQGVLPDYKRREELAGLPSSDRYLRQWFSDFDRALAYPPFPRGRPPSKSRKRW